MTGVPMMGGSGCERDKTGPAFWVPAISECQRRDGLGPEIGGELGHGRWKARFRAGLRLEQRESQETFVDKVRCTKLGPEHRRIEDEPLDLRPEDGQQIARRGERCRQIENDSFSCLVSCLVSC